MTEDPEDRGYRPTRRFGQLQVQSVSISNGDERWPVGSPGGKGQGINIITSRKQGCFLRVQCGNQATKQHACGKTRAGPVEVSSPETL